MKLPDSDKKVIIAPSLLASDFGNLQSEILKATTAQADWLHIDVMDGTFVPPITFGDNLVSVAKKNSSLPLDVHLMIVEPEKHIETFAKAGANIITVHQETCPHLHRTLASIKDLGVSAGASINPATPVESLFDCLEVADLVLVMTVNPGWGGQKFIHSCLKKIEKIQNEISRRGLSTRIEVDGGINSETAKLCRQAGASIFVAGSYLFSAANMKDAIASLK
jgi:ribulose-phosphate 3-epimerase